MGLVGRYRIELCGEGGGIGTVIDSGDSLDTARSLYSHTVMNHPNRLVMLCDGSASSPAVITPKQCRSNPISLSWDLLTRATKRCALRLKSVKPKRLASITGRMMPCPAVLLLTLYSIAMAAG